MSAALGCPVAGCAGTATWPVLTVLLPWAAGDVAGLCPNDSEAITATAKRVVRNREVFMGPILCSAGTRRQARRSDVREPTFAEATAWQAEMRSQKADVRNASTCLVLPLAQGSEAIMRATNGPGITPRKITIAPSTDSDTHCRKSPPSPTLPPRFDFGVAGRRGREVSCCAGSSTKITLRTIR